MFCSNCGNKLKENSVFCSNCGKKIVKRQEPKKEKPNVVVTNNTVQNNNESSPVGWGFLGFFIPIVGIVLFFVWLKEKPKSSKAAGIGALIRIILSILLIGFIFLLSFIDAYKSYDYNYPSGSSYPSYYY